MTDKEFEELYSKLDAYVKAHVDEYRYKHTQGVVKAIEKYALKYGADVKKAKIAAIFHDACKGQNLGLEHGKAAARIIRDEFGVEDEDIINAIANQDRKSTRLNSSHPTTSRMPSSA